MKGQHVAEGLRKGLRTLLALLSLERPIRRLAAKLTSVEAQHWGMALTLAWIAFIILVASLFVPHLAEGIKHFLNPPCPSHQYDGYGVCVDS